MRDTAVSADRGGSEDAVRNALVGIAAHGLGVQRMLPDEPLDPVTWERFLFLARQERLAGLLAYAVRAEEMPVTKVQAERVEDMALRVMSHCLMLERMALEAIAALGEAGIATRVLKGVAVANLDYPNPALRPFVDVDVLVPTGQAPTAATVLASVGLQRTAAPLSDRYERLFMKSSTFTEPSGRQLDLHRTLAIGPVGLAIPQADLWTGSEEFTLGGVRVQALDRPRRVMHAAITVAVADWPSRLIAQRDLAELVVYGGADLREVLEAADRWQARPVLLQAVADTWRTLGLPDDLPEGFAAAIGVPPSQVVVDEPSRRLLDLYRREHRSFTRLALAGFRTVPPGDRVDYARALLVPDRRHVRNRLRKLVARIPGMPSPVRRGAR